MRIARAVVPVALVLLASPALAAGGDAGAPPPAASSSSGATAPASPPPAAAELDPAVRALLAEGTAALDGNDNDKAYALLSAAWKAQTHWQVAAALGAAATKLGKLPEAANLFALYAREAPPDQKEKADALLAEAAAKVGAVIVAVDVPDAEILVDGVAVSAKPGATFYVEADVRHKVAARKGDALGEADLLTRAGRTHNVTLTIGSSGTEGGPRKEIVITGAAVTGATLIVGIATGVAALGASDNAGKKLEAVRAAGVSCKGSTSGACADLLTARNEQSTLTNAAFWSLLGAGAAGISTTIYVLATRSKPPATSVAVTPAIGATGGGLTITGRW